MTMQILAKTPSCQIKTIPTETGTEFQIRLNGRAISAFRTMHGLWDVQTEDDRILYTGYSEKRAAETCAAYLKG